MASIEIDGANGVIKSTVSDSDLTIKGNDGGSEISALTFDMSDAGAATFNGTAVMDGNSWHKTNIGPAFASASVDVNVSVSVLSAVVISTPSLNVTDVAVTVARVLPPTSTTSVSSVADDILVS